VVGNPATTDAILTVVGWSGTEVVLAAEDATRVRFLPRHLELVEASNEPDEAEDRHSMELRVGDRVRVLQSGVWIGAIGTIVNFHSSATRAMLAMSGGGQATFETRHLQRMPA
jgi:transcription antitermination factor NusG